MSSEHIRPQQPATRYKFKKIENIPICKMQRYYSNADVRVRMEWFGKKETFQHIHSPSVWVVCVCVCMWFWTTNWWRWHRIWMLIGFVGVFSLMKGHFPLFRFVSFATMQAQTSENSSASYTLSWLAVMMVAVASNANTFRFGCAYSILSAEHKLHRKNWCCCWRPSFNGIQSLPMGSGHAINCWPIYSVYEVNSVSTPTTKNPDNAHFMVRRTCLYALK